MMNSFVCYQRVGGSNFEFDYFVLRLCIMYSGMVDLMFFRRDLNFFIFTVFVLRPFLLMILEVSMVKLG